MVELEESWMVSTASSFDRMPPRWRKISLRRHPQQRRRPRSSSSGALSLSMAAKQRRDVRPAAPLAAPSPSFTGAADPGAARKMIFPPSPSCESVKRLTGSSTSRCARSSPPTTHSSATTATAPWKSPPAST
ncbi:uncharacterized protein LOC144951757 isoform X3 [Lampetra fluviatilis]